MSEEVKKHELAAVDYMAGMKYKDIAAKYGVKLDTVKSWKKRYGWDRKKGAHKIKKRCTQKNIESNKDKKPIIEEVNKVVEYDDLTDKQRLFCILYIRCFNATRAYQKAYDAGYETAAVEAHKLLKNPKIKEIILELKQNRFNRELLSEDDIFQKYMDIAFADINDYMSIKSGHVALKDSANFDGTIIKKITTGKVTSIELQDKMRALQWLSDHMDLATEKQKAEIAMLRTKINNGTDKDKEFRKQAKENMAKILEQIKAIEDDDVYK